ncbi:replication initiation protein RepC, partial [Acidiphilium multivorum]
QDTVSGIEKSSPAPVGSGATAETTGLRNGRSGSETGRGEQKPARRDDGTVLRITPDELVRLAPRLLPYLGRSSPAWPDVVEAADWLRHDLGVSKPLWGEACIAMGREQAAIALAIVSARPAGHFRSTPGGYFHGMVAKARAGELNLGKTIWGMRSKRDTHGWNQPQ